MLKLTFGGPKVPLVGNLALFWFGEENVVLDNIFPPSFKFQHIQREGADNSGQKHRPK
jgi:hypothetical protein